MMPYGCCVHCGKVLPIIYVAGTPVLSDVCPHCGGKSPKLTTAARTVFDKEAQMSVSTTTESEGNHAE
jgi:predicted  nucleic acid-binding Zn-ribbon protein